MQYANGLYKETGKIVINEYCSLKSKFLSRDAIINGMKNKIIELGPTNVSRHASDPHVLNVFDISPRSIVKKEQFEKAVHEDVRISGFLKPPHDPGYHLEIPQPKS